MMNLKKRLSLIFAVITVFAFACAPAAPAFGVSADSSAAAVIPAGSAGSGVTGSTGSGSTAGVTGSTGSGSTAGAAVTAAAPAASKAAPKIEAEGAIVIDAATGKILYEKNRDKKLEPASTTKIVTCMLALEHLQLDQVITAKSEGTRMGSVINIEKGEQFRVEDLLHALMLPSANDAAVVLAEEIGGDVEHFCRMMDEKAAECGAKNTHFRNPNGINWAGQEDHLTTAYDLAVIAREAMKDKTFRRLVTTRTYTIPATNKSPERRLILSNRLMWNKDTEAAAKEIASAKDNNVNGAAEQKPVPYYEGAIGIKTGLTSTAGGCLVGAVERHGTELISVVLHSSTRGRFIDTTKLWDYVLDNAYTTQQAAAAGEEVGKVRVKHGEYRNVTAVMAKAAAVTFPAGEEAGDIRTELEKQKLQAPVRKGDKVGELAVYRNDRLIERVDALAATDIGEGGPLSYIGIPDWLAVMIYIAVPLIILLLIVIHLLRRKSGHRSRRQRRRERRRRQEERRQQAEQNGTEQ